MGYATSIGGNRGRSRRRQSAVAAAVAIFAVALLAPTAASAWAPASQARLHPGVMTFTKGVQCTSNFVFADAKGVYLGQAAHCSGTGDQTDQINSDGCTSGKLPIGTRVRIEGASRLGTLVYSSWNTMQARHEERHWPCVSNDFALVRIAPADRGRVNPSVPGFGGPTGIGGAGIGDPVYSYGNSSLRQGIRQLSPKQGWVIDRFGDGWRRTVYMVTPGIPGDSGSGFINASGQAIGVLTSIYVTPTPAANGSIDLGRAIAYMRSHSRFTGVRLARGTEPFDPSLVGAIAG